MSEFAGRLGYPRLDRGADDPLLILANLPCPIYLTTSPYTFIEEALRRGRQGAEERVLPLAPGLDNVPSVFAAAGQSAIYRAQPAEPLVYHLYGLDAYPDSLVLTEDDHLDFLMAVSQGRGKERASTRCMTSSRARSSRRRCCCWGSAWRPGLSARFTGG